FQFQPLWRCIRDISRAAQPQRDDLEVPNGRKVARTMKPIPVTQLRRHLDALRTSRQYVSEKDAPLLVAAIRSLEAELGRPAERCAVMRLAPAEAAPALGLYPEPMRHDARVD